MILVTGGSGYIGSHTVLVLLQAGFEVVVLDNLSNSSTVSLERIAQITGKKAVFIKGDIRNRALLDKLFSDYLIESVINFAGLKAVGESTKNPLAYYQCNVHGACTLLEAMNDAGVKSFVFSSSATVYGEPETDCYHENLPTGHPTSPYGRSKLMIEEILKDLQTSDNEWKIAILRYFNPVGAHQSGKIGENPTGIPNNLLPYISQVAIGKLPYLNVFGDDYNTPDGTAMRDYIHVMDLAEAHLDAMNAIMKINTANESALKIWNLGTGQPYSVLEMVKAFEDACGHDIKYKIAPRRAGDIAKFYADASLAKAELGWTAKLGLSDMMEDTWRWQSNNPNGYNHLLK